MPEPFKNLFNPTLITRMGDHLSAADPGFDRAAFIAAACEGLEALEMKERSAHIQAALDPLLPQDFRAACDVMLASLSPKTDEDWKAEDIETLGICGWAVMPMAEIVAARGLGDFDHAMGVLAEMTKRFTAEFAVRPFLIADPERGLKIARQWAEDDNYHVRRFASEGTRPRLPWGLRLQSFVEDPQPLLPLLTRLRDDPSEYVRRSVANSLNDIAKDHPDLIAGIAADWLQDAPKDRVRLVKHACRTLIKAGHAPTLEALGYGPAEVAGLAHNPCRAGREHGRTSGVFGHCHVAGQARSAPDHRLRNPSPEGEWSDHAQDVQVEGDGAWAGEVGDAVKAACDQADHHAGLLCGAACGGGADQWAVVWRSEV